MACLKKIRNEKFRSVVVFGSCVHVLLERVCLISGLEWSSLPMDFGGWRGMHNRPNVVLRFISEFEKILLLLFLCFCFFQLWMPSTSLPVIWFMVFRFLYISIICFVQSSSLHTCAGQSSRNCTTTSPVLNSSLVALICVCMCVCVCVCLPLFNTAIFYSEREIGPGSESAPRLFKL